MKAIYLFLLFGMVATGCKKSVETPTGNLTVTGLLQKQGTTTYQYGTHTINNATLFYALRSGNVKLDDYAGKQVTITANKVYGYPVEGGPDLLEVVTIKE